tara:strand:+ start:634 stop:810 length:177 start_codon:yes stop_codon:yes gene_type:complete
MSNIISIKKYLKKDSVNGSVCGRINRVKTNVLPPKVADIHAQKVPITTLEILGANIRK